VLLLFDIDGTLLSRASREHAVAIHRAIEDVHGVDVRARLAPGPDVAGRTDGEIARMLLSAAGVLDATIDAHADAVRDRACELYVRLCPEDLSNAVVPGIPDLLAWLSQQPGVTLALLTGNFEPIARLKLKRAGVGRYFPDGQGGFGSDAEARAELPPVARRRAGGSPRDQTVVIGDTPRDIACAKADGLRCIAVSTGPYPAMALTEADVVCANAEELRVALSSLL
jgi:phosphoglycolate phosphatase-like HAD superfamily hydrolase